jgi:hypothetical protein
MTRMSLLQEWKGTSGPVPKLEGKEVLVGRDPSVCKVKGVMFGGRKHFLVDTIGEDGFLDIVANLSPRSAQYAKTPLASAWCEFESLIEVDRAIHESMKAKFPNVLPLIGAASAELGIGKVYKVFDSEELTKFLEGQTMFHNQYQKFGRVRFERTPAGGKMIYTDYPCYSPVYCASAIGFFLESILRHGGTNPNVTETKCHCRGDMSCTYDLTWK